MNIDSLVKPWTIFGTDLPLARSLDNYVDASWPIIFDRSADGCQDTPEEGLIITSGLVTHRVALNWFQCLKKSSSEYNPYMFKNMIPEVVFRAWKQEIREYCHLQNLSNWLHRKF